MCKNENLEVCKKCGGNCCKNMPGAYSPEDLFKGEEITKESIKRLIMESDNLSIDRWEADEEYGEELYYIRPKLVSRKPGMSDWFDLLTLAIGKCDSEKKVDFAIVTDNHQCYFLGENGCKLSYDQRPKNCRDLIPNPENGCYIKEVKEQNMSEKLYYAKMWEPYSEMIEKVSEEILFGDDMESFEAEKDNV